MRRCVQLSVINFPLKKGKVLNKKAWGKGNFNCAEKRNLFCEGDTHFPVPISDKMLREAFKETPKPCGKKF